MQKCADPHRVSRDVENGFSNLHVDLLNNQERKECCGEAPWTKPAKEQACGRRRVGADK